MTRHIIQGHGERGNKRLFQISVIDRKELRTTLPKYGFGRCELLPIISTSEAIGNYVGKYIRKHIENRLEEDKGVHLVQYTKGARVCSTRFSWIRGYAYTWRKGMQILSTGFQAVGYRLKTSDDFKTAFGPKWAWRLGSIIIAVGEDEFTVGEGINRTITICSQYGDFSPKGLLGLRTDSIAPEAPECPWIAWNMQKPDLNL